MTDTKTFDVQGATLTVTLVLQQHSIDITMTLDTSALDMDEPDHSQHNLIAYAGPLLPEWDAPQSYWWCRRRRALTVRTGAQAHRVIRHALAATEDAIAAATLNRDRRKAEMQIAWR